MLSTLQAVSPYFSTLWGKSNAHSKILHTETGITIPDFMVQWRSKQGWPWEVSPHIASESINMVSERWMRSYDGVSDVFIDKIIEGDFPFIACLIYGHQDKESCLLAALVMLHFFAIDEITDHQEEPEVRRLCAAIVKALRVPEPRPPKSAPAVVRMAADISAQSCHTSTRESWKLFVDWFGDYLNGVGEEAASRKKPILGRKKYMDIRRKSIGVLPGIALIMNDCVVRSGFFKIETVETLLGLCIDILINQNDIYSFDKEQAKGEDGHNGVRILMEEHGISVQESMDRLGGETKDLIHRFIDLCEAPSTLQNEVDNAHLTILRDGCISWISGMELWTTVITKRYGMQRLDKNRSYIPRPRK
jgi:Delta6-protoilludene synthase